MKWVVTKGNENLVHHTIEFPRRQVEADVGCRQEVRVPDDPNGSGSSLERQRVDHRKLDKKVRSLSETFQQLPLTGDKYRFTDQVNAD